VLTTNQKGAIAEAAVIYECAKLGVPVARPLEDLRYDLILDLGSQLLRVQVKWASGDGQVIFVRCRRARRGREGLIHRTYLPGEIDAVAAYSPDTERCYVLPYELSVDCVGVQLRLTPTRNNQAAGIRWARDYELAAKLAELTGAVAQLGERRAASAKARGSSPLRSTLF
jgi:hypothetical protein